MGGSSYSPSSMRSSSGYEADTSLDEDHLPDAQVTHVRKKVDSINQPRNRGTISTDSPNPVIVAFDDTGSMGDWVDDFYKRAPMFYGQIRLHHYLDDPSLGIAVVSDYFSDPEGLQVTDFCRGDALDHAMESLLIQRQGGRGSKESYNLAAYYYTKKFDARQRPQRPLFFFFGDEGFYETMKPEEINEVFGDDVDEALDSMSVFAELRERFECYILRKPYSDKGSNEVIQDQWERALGKEFVVMLEKGGQVVDTMLGIIAMRSGMDLNSYLAQLKGRKQSDERIRRVRHSLLPTAQKQFADIHKEIELGETEQQVRFETHENEILNSLPKAVVEGATIVINVNGDFITGDKSHTVKDSVVMGRGEDNG